MMLYDKDKLWARGGSAMSNDTILKGHDLFRSLGLEKAFEIKSFSAVKEYREGEVIFNLNETAGHVFMLLEGSVDLRLPSKRQDYSLVVSKIEKGELFGLSPLLGSARYTATAQCGGATKLLAIEAAPFRKQLSENCVIGFSIMSQVARIYFDRYIHVLANLQDIAAQISLIR
jgi:CRP-like cAMP-binding protein